jgi:CRISPR-associated protein Cmr4
VDVTEYLLYLYAESPVHAGAADSLDVLDLPVQREAATGYPVIWGQSLKGALRQAARQAGGQWGDALVQAIFGSAIGDAAEGEGTTPGLLNVGDAQLVAMPVPTLRRTFAWVSSDIALGRLARKYTTLGREVPPLPKLAPDCGLAAEDGWASTREVLGPCLVPLSPCERVRGWAQLLASDVMGSIAVLQPFAEKLRTDLLVIGSDIMPMLLRECTEQAVRVQLKEDKKTVEEGPFHSEYLPAETIMAAALVLRPSGETPAHQEALRELLDGALLQVGGDETLGKGLVWGRLLETQR